MTDVKRPRLLDNSLHETAIIYPLGLQLNLQTPGVSTAVITLAPNDHPPAIHSWVALYNQNGFVGYYRVTSPTTDYQKQNVITLRHGIDSMSDSVLAAQEDYNGTPAALLARIINAQTTLINGVKPWALGDVDALSNIEIQLNYQRLSELLANIEEQLEDYYFVYDQTVFPWQLHLKSKPSTIGSEFRMNRNIMTISRTLNDNDLCTQLILSINVTTTTTGSNPVTSTNTIVKTYDNPAAQAIYGIIQKTADIDTHDNITADPPVTTEADAWASQFLADHSQPTVQIQISAQELRQITGDDWDEAKLGHMCRVALPEYSEAFVERVVNVSYPDALGQPDTVNISLANQLPQFSATIANLKNDTARNARTGRSLRRSAADAKEAVTWSQHVTYYGEALDGTGILTLYETGIDMDASGGATIYSLEEGFQSNYAAINVNSRKISLVVTESGGQDVINTAAIVLGINSQDKTSSSYVDISANYINLTGYVTATALDARLINVDDLFATTGYAGTIYASSYSGTSGNITSMTVGNLYMTTSGQSSEQITRKAVKIGGITSSTLTVLGAGTSAALEVPDSVTGFGAASYASGQADVTIPFYTIAHPSSSPAAGNVINFNIAATTAYINGVAAAETSGKMSVTLSGGSWAWDDNNSVFYATVSASAPNTNSLTVNLPTITTAQVGSNVYVYAAEAGGTTHTIATQPISGGSGGISNMTVDSGASSEPTADYGGGTLTCNKWFVVTATPNSGSSATFKFKTGSPSIDINPQEWRDSGQAAPSGAGNATSLNITGSYIAKGKLGTCYFKVTAGATTKWYKIPVDTR